MRVMMHNEVLWITSLHSYATVHHPIEKHCCVRTYHKPAGAGFKSQTRNRAPIHTIRSAFFVTSILPVCNSKSPVVYKGVYLRHKTALVCTGSRGVILQSVSMEVQTEGNNHAPPAFQTQTSGRIFFDSTKQPLRIFVESAEVFDRPKTVRKLKNNGATLTLSPEEASIILVDPETTSGGQFAKEWGNEPGKVVLDVAWAQKSIERGKALLADEGWGGCWMAGSQHSFNQNPLPTPRGTPLDAQPPQNEAAMYNQQQFPTPNGQIPHGGVPPGYPFQQMQQPPQFAQQMPNGPQNGPAPVPGMQPNPNAQVTLPAHLVAQLVGLMSQQGVNPATFGMQPMMPQAPMNLMQGQGLQGFSQQAIPFMPQPGMFPQPFPLSQQQAPFPQPPVMPPVSQMQSVAAGPSNHFQSMGASTPDCYRSASQVRRQSTASDTFRSSPMEDVRGSSLKRRSPAGDGEPSGSSRKHGKRRADGERAAKQRRVSYPSDEPALPYPDLSPSDFHDRDPIGLQGMLFVQDDGEPYKFFVQIDIRPRTKIADAIKKNGGKLVPDIADADFVILGQPTTRTFEERLNQCINCQKVAIRSQWVFACVEQNAIVDLDDYVFEGYKIQKKRGRPTATGKRFIVTGPNGKPLSQADGPSLLQDEDADMAEDGVEEERFLRKSKGKAKSKTNEKPMSKEPAKLSAKKEQPKKEKPVKPGRAEKKASKSKAAGPSGDRTSKGVDKGKAGSTPAKSSNEPPSAQAFWPPSPPPPTRVVKHSTGKNLYTQDDLDYVDAYLPILFLRDPDMTYSAISEKMHDKMPHHSLKSWQTHIFNANRRDKFERMRRQAQIARRKGHPGGTKVSQEPDVGALPPQPQATEATPPVSAAETTSELPDPVMVLADFFANGGADNLADSEVWNTIHQKHPEKSAQAWEDYWIDHNEQISGIVAQLSGVPAQESEAPIQYGNGGRVKAEPE
ncbi:hypothetical protein BD413DRAFT_508065 [Trametes elegans]|nr:hypothetical protein BD413DRAFT_508065 [Trametes elegans]